MPTPPPIPRDQDLFDEAGYLRLYPGLIDAIAAGDEASAWHHFDKHGRREGRRPNDVDPTFYLEAYPRAAEEVAAGAVGDAAEHYVRRGRARGYQPNETASRDTNLLMPSVFPWLWTDLPHALDVIDGRVELGRLTNRQAALLRRWVRDGFVVLDRTVDRTLVAAAALELERGFAGAKPNLLFACEAIAPQPMPWQPEINPHPAASLDPHYLSQPMRDLLCAEPIAEFLGLIFDARPVVTQSRGVLRNAPPVAHRDSADAGYSLARQFASAWIVLEEPGADAGTIHHFAGSHRFPNLPADALERRVTELGLVSDRLVGAVGSVVIRHPDLVHGGTQGSVLTTQRGVQAHYCPRFVAPVYAETVPTRLFRRGGNVFTTRHYPDIEPQD